MPLLLLPGKYYMYSRLLLDLDQYSEFLIKHITTEVYCLLILLLLHNNNY